MMRTLLTVGALLALTPLALAAPSLVPYAGYLSDASGAPYVGSVDVRAAIYGCATEAEGCEALWEGAVREAVSVSSGLLRFELGADGDPELTEVLTGAEALWLDIELKLEGAESWTSLEPRHGLHAVPFAISAVNADKLGGMEAQDYATAAELDVFTRLEDIAAAGYLTDTQLADAGYLTSEALEAMAYLTQADIDQGGYVTAAQLSALLDGDPEAGSEGYATPSDIASSIAEMVTTTALQATLEAYVTTEALSGTLQDYITASALSTSLEPYLLASNAYTNDMALLAVEAAGYAKLDELEPRYTDEEAVSAVEAAGYALEAELPPKYTDEEAVAAAEAGGFAREAALMKAIAVNLEGPDTAEGFLTSDIIVEVSPGESLSHVVIDLSAEASLSYVPPTNGVDNGDPKEQWNPTWDCGVDVIPAEGSTLEAETLSGWGQIGTLFDVTPKTFQVESRSHRFYFSTTQTWRDEGFSLTISCNSFCTPFPGVNSGCVYTTSTRASVTTF